MYILFHHEYGEIGEHHHVFVRSFSDLHKIYMSKSIASWCLTLIQISLSHLCMSMNHEETMVQGFPDHGQRCAGTEFER